MKTERLNGAVVIVEPETRHLWPSAITKESLQSLCADIEEQIKRHVDGVGYTYIEFQTEDVCEHCGAVWTEGDSPHNGGCCAKDAEILAIVDAGGTVP